ncbi:MAG: SPOR domain-containing protein, partial [Propionivibrio sp.]
PVASVVPAAPAVQVAQVPAATVGVDPSPGDAPAPPPVDLPATSTTVSPVVSPAPIEPVPPTAPAPENVLAAATPAESIQPDAAVADANPASVATAPPTFAERLAASDAWIAATPGSHYFIQLLSTDGGSESDVERFLDREAVGLDPAQVRVYRSSLSGQDRIGVIYGDFSSRVEANAELARLAGISRLNPARKPYVRAVSKLR